MSSSRQFGPSLQDEILTILVEGPSYGYEIIRHLENDHGEVRLNTLYRWLSNMERHHLVESEILPGSIGPDRRVYRLAARGRRRIRRLFRNAIKVVMQLYDEYRHYSMGGLKPVLESTNTGSTGGRILLSGIPRLAERHLDLAQYLASKSDKGMIRTVGDSTALAGTGINHYVHDGSVCDISAPRRYFQEALICGVPKLDTLSSALEELKRVLAEDGSLRIVASRVCFSQPTEHRLDDFLIVSAIHLFPSLGIIGADALSSEIKRVFGNCSVSKVFQGVGLFQAYKSETCYETVRKKRISDNHMMNNED